MKQNFLENTRDYEIPLFYCKVIFVWMLKLRAWKESYDVKKKEENRKYYNWFRYELFNDKKQIFLDNNHIMCESIFSRYKNLSSFRGWVKFDVRFFFRLCRANNYDENYPIDRSIVNEISLSSSYFSFITFSLYFSLTYPRIPIKFE